MDQDQRKKLYAALAAPFPETAIERSDGRVTGRGYDTTGIKYQYVVNRLNEALGVGGYRVERTITVKEVTTAKGRPAFDAVCEITLELGEWVGGAFLPFAEALGDGGHTSTSEADARKGSYTNAFKKAAAFHGVGKQAYEGTLDDDNVPTTMPSDAPPPPATPRSVVPRPAEAASEAPATATAPSRNRLSAKQLAAIWAIARSRGFDDQTFRGKVSHRFGVQPEYLTRVQASDLIGALNGNGHDRQPGQEG